MRYSRIVPALAVLAILVSAAPIISRVAAPQQESPILTQVKAAVKDPAQPFTLVLRLKIKEGTAMKFEAAFATAAKETHKEKGNRAYDLNRDAKTPTQYLIYERWQNVAALEAHLKTPHITKLLAERGDLVAAAPEANVLVPVGG